MQETKPKNRIAPWVWFVNLGLAAAFTYFLFFLKTVPETPDTSDLNPKASAPAESASQSNGSNKGTDFDFYEMLPETKVKTPTVEEYKPKRQPENVHYLLQTGSFRNASDAERQKATIAFQGLKADVRRIEVESDDIWYRVQVGPYKSRSRMNSAIDKLVAINIQPLVRKQVLETD